MTRTTIDIDATVLAELKERSRREGKSMGALASELLARSLARHGASKDALTWFTSPMGALVDLEDRDRVQAALDEP